ncbi:hypothetical protein FB008_11556 [Sinorhizobium medicae]|nr:hypothetical protein FB008_11556 [Sinorhizobium medicae]
MAEIFNLMVSSKVVQFTDDFLYPLLICALRESIPLSAWSTMETRAFRPFGMIFRS